MERQLMQQQAQRQQQQHQQHQQQKGACWDPQACTAAAWQALQPPSHQRTSSCSSRGSRAQSNLPARARRCCLDPSSLRQAQQQAQQAQQQQGEMLWT